MLILLRGLRVNVLCDLSCSMTDEKDSSHQFDDIIKTVCEFGRWQKFIYFTTCALVIVPSGIHIAGMYFITGTPKFHCVTPNTTCLENKCCDNCTEYAFDGPFISTATEVRIHVVRLTFWQRENSQKFFQWRICEIIRDTLYYSINLVYLNSNTRFCRLT